MSQAYSNHIQNDIIRSEKKSEKRPNYYGRDDRATSEQVMDPRTRLMLFKLLSNNFLSEIDGNYVLMDLISCFYLPISEIGCLSTGKEANVYYAKSSSKGSGIETDIKEYAVKIFKTSILGY